MQGNQGTQREGETAAEQQVGILVKFHKKRSSGIACLCASVVSWGVVVVVVAVWKNTEQ